jgi:two-component system sensor histidine kinase TrcS
MSRSTTPPPRPAKGVRRPWTLRRRLVVGIGTVVAAVFAVLGVISVVTLASSVTTVVDTQLSGSMSGLSHTVERLRNSDTPPTDPSGRPYVKPFVDYTGHGAGTIIALAVDGTIVDSAQFSDEAATVLDDAVIDQLELQSQTATSRSTVSLPGLGTYRLATQLDSAGNTLIAGVSMRTADSAVMQETIVISIMSVLALLIVVFGVILIVRHTLRPLDRVVSTAAAVATMPLDRGEVAITTRVDTADTDPRTEVGKVGEALNLLLAHVDDALAVRAATDTRMRRFVTDASHELRTPLAAIQGYAELTRQDSAELPEMTEYSLARIESEAKRMNSLVSDLLLLARLDEGQDLHLDEVDLGEIVVNAASDVRAAYPQHTWTIDVPDGATPVVGDQERLHQLVMNLLSNAAVHTPPGTSVVARLATVVDAEGRPCVEVSITDDGPGIADDLVPELFERFARGDSSRSRTAGSSGLGLAIVASIVDAHDGQITVASSSEGTRFTVRLAGAAASPAAASAAVALPEDYSPESSAIRR